MSNTSEKKNSEKLNDDFNHRELFQSLVTFFFSFHAFFFTEPVGFQIYGRLDHYTPFKRIREGCDWNDQKNI